MRRSGNSLVAKLRQSRLTPDENITFIDTVKTNSTFAGKVGLREFFKILARDSAKMAQAQEIFDVLREDFNDLNKMRRSLDSFKDSVLSKQLKNAISPDRIVENPINIFKEPVLDSQSITALLNNIGNTIEKLTDNQQAYSNKDIVNMLKGDTLDDNAEAVKTLLHDPHSEVLMILGDVYASLKYIDLKGSDFSKKDKALFMKKTNIALSGVLKIDPLKFTYSGRTKKVSRILSGFTKSCMRILKINDNDYKRMKAHGVFRVGRKKREYNGDNFKLTYDPIAQLTAEQVSKNEELYGKYGYEQWGIYDEIIGREIKKSSVEVNSEIGSSKGRDNAKTANLIKLDLTTQRGDYKLEATMTTHADWSPMDFNHSDSEKRSEERIDCARLNFDQTLQKGFGALSFQTEQLNVTEVASRKQFNFRKKPIFLTKNLMMISAGGSAIPMSGEGEMVKNKEKVLREKIASYPNLSIISLMHPLNFSQQFYDSSRNKPQYIKLFSQLMNNLAVDLGMGEGPILSTISQAIDCLNENPPNLQEFKNQVEEIRDQLSGNQHNGRIMALSAISKMTDFLEGNVNYGGDLKLLHFWQSALDTVMIAGICDKEEAVIDSHCKSGKDRTYSEVIFSTTMTQYAVTHDGNLPDFANLEVREEFSQIFLKTYEHGIAQRHASQDNVGSWGLKSLSNLPRFIYSTLSAAKQFIINGPEERNNVTSYKPDDQKFLKRGQRFALAKWNKAGDLIRIVNKFPQNDKNSSSKKEEIEKNKDVKKELMNHKENMKNTVRHRSPSG